MDTKDIIAIFKESGFSGVAYDTTALSRFKVCEKRDTVFCDYHGSIRKVCLGSCKWHIAENDPWCVSRRIELNDEFLFRNCAERIRFIKRRRRYR
jgi:hypothetical protein